MKTFIPFVLALALPAVAWSGPIASFAQTTPGTTPFTYLNSDGTFSASTAVVFNFLAANDSGATGPVPALLTLSGTTTGDVFLAPNGLLIEEVAGATFSILGAGGPLNGLNLLSGSLTGNVAGQGSTAATGGSQIAGKAITLTSAFQYDVGSGLQFLTDPNVFNRDVIFGLAGVTPSPLTRFNNNLSGSPAGSNWSSAISGLFSAVPEPATCVMTSLGVAAVVLIGRRRRAA